MHPNPVFRQEPNSQNLAFAKAQGFGVLAVPTKDDVLLSHVPFIVADNGESALLHLVRSNPIVRTKAERLTAKIAVQGPHGYVSPDWYGVEEQVPTWNYVAVHLIGELVKLEQAEIRRVVDEISAFFEAQVPEKKPWVSDKMDQETLEKMLIQIVPYRFEIKDISGTWKLNQNKTDAAREGAAQEMAESAIGSETTALARLMLG